MNHSRMVGCCTKHNEIGKQAYFDFWLADQVTGKLRLTFDDEPTIKEEVVVDLKKKVIQSPEFEEKMINLYAVESVDQA